MQMSSKLDNRSTVDICMFRYPKKCQKSALLVYFASLSLLRVLDKANIKAVCTLRQARTDPKGSPCPVKSERALKKEGRGAYDVYHWSTNMITCVVWGDNRGVLLGSNFVGVTELDICKRWDRKEKKDIEVTLPNIVKTYNAFMGGVDKTNRLAALYSIDFRSQKW